MFSDRRRCSTVWKMPHTALDILHLHRECFLEWCWTYQFRETVTDIVPLRLPVLGHSREYAYAPYHTRTRCRGYSKVSRISAENVSASSPQFDICQRAIFVELFLPRQCNIDRNVLWYEMSQNKSVNLISLLSIRIEAFKY